MKPDHPFRYLPEKMIFWSTCSLALLPVVSLNFNSITIIVWISLLLISRLLPIKRPVEQRKPDSRILFFLLSGNFILYLISLLYTENLAEGLSALQVSLPMLVFPFGFFLLPASLDISKRSMQLILMVFWLSCHLTALFLFYHFIRMGLLQNWDNVDSFYNVYRETAIKMTGKHPTYLSIYFSFAVFITITWLSRERSIFKIIVYSLSIVFLLGLILQLGSRTAIISLPLSLVVILFFKVKSNYKWILIASVIALFAVLIRVTPAVYTRLEEGRNTAFVPPRADQYNSTNIRAGIYYCSWKIIARHWLLGVGVGDDKKMLSDCYATLPTNAYASQYYNTHNQYVNFWLVTGIGSLLLFIASLGYAFYVAFQRGNYILLYFLIIMSCSFLSENILSRQAGAAFYYFFISLLLYGQQVSAPFGSHLIFFRKSRIFARINQPGLP